MKTFAALFIGLAVLAAQVLHGGAFVPALAWPAYGCVVIAAIFALIGLLRSPLPPSPFTALLVVGVSILLVARCWGGPDRFLGRLDAVPILAAGLTVLVVSTLTDRSSKWMFLAVVIAAFFYQAAVCMMQIATRGEWTAPHWFSAALQSFYDGRFEARARGGFLNPNQLSWFLGGLAVLAASLALWARLWWGSRLLLGFLSAACVALDVLTGSRAGVAGMGAGFLALIFLSMSAAVSLSRRGAGGGRMAVGAIAAIVILGGVVFVTLSNSWAAQGRSGSFALPDDVRSNLISEAWRGIQLAPMTGLGPGSFLYLGRLYRQGIQPGDPIFAHNDWIELWMEYGFPCFAAVAAGLAIVCAGGLRKGRRLIREIGDVRSDMVSTRVGWLFGAAGAILAMSLHSFFDFNFRIPANLLFASALLGILLQPLRAAGSRGRILFDRAVNFGMILLFGGALAWAGQRFARADFLELSGENARFARAYVPAIRDATEGLRLDPENERLKSLLARATFAKEFAGVTRDDFGRLNSQRIDDSAEGEAGFAATAKALAGTRRLYEELLAQNPRERAYPAEYSQVLALSGQNREAIAAAVRSVALDPRHGYAYEALGRACVDAGDERAAWKIYCAGARMPGGEACAARLESEPSDAELKGQGIP